ncbi:MAG: hypothetical protein WEA35_09580 [Candidatus Nanopelagicales bacterium]
MADLREILTDIYTRRGSLTPEDVVEESKSPDSALHHRFLWDDVEAGERYRLVQAAALIRSVKVRFVEPDSQEAHEVRAFVSVRETTDPERCGYQPTEEVLTDPLASAILLREMERAITDLKRRYGHLQDYREVIRRGFGDDLAV